MSLIDQLPASFPQILKDAAVQIKERYDNLSQNRPILAKAVKIFGGATALFITTQIIRRAWYTLYFKYKKYPPGPIGIPFFGCFLSRWNLLNFYKFPTNIGYQYYPVAMYPYGPWSYGIMISDKKLIDKVSKMDELSHRPSIWANMVPDGVRPAFSAINGKEMIQRRKLFQSTIIRMTDSKYFISAVQRNIKERIVVPNIENAIKNKNGKWMPWDAAFCYAFNTIYGAAFDPEITIDMEDEDYKEFKSMTEQIFKTLLWFFMMTVIAPNYMKKGAKSEASQKFQNKMRAILSKWMENRKESNDKSTESYVDIMLKSLDKDKANADIMGTFQAGAHTTASSVENQLYTLAKHPYIQEKIYSQLREIFNDSDDIVLKSSEDFKNLSNKASYLRAFIEETWRLPLTGMGNPRILPKDIKVEFVNKYNENDYYILPKGSFVEFNGPYLVRNKEYGWKNPKEFDIGNYLDEDEKFKNPVSGLDIFGYGKRDCPGMVLARKENLFAIAILVYKYKFCGPKGEGDTDFTVPFFSQRATFPLTVVKR